MQKLRFNYFILGAVLSIVIAWQVIFALIFVIFFVNLIREKKMSHHIYSQLSMIVGVGLGYLVYLFFTII